MTHPVFHPYLVLKDSYQEQQPVHVGLVNDLLSFIIHLLKRCKINDIRLICTFGTPRCFVYFRWDWVVILLVLYTGIITPYTISFLSDEDQKRSNLNAQASTREFNRERTSTHLLVVIDVLVDTVFILDILISFR